MSEEELMYIIQENSGGIKYIELIAILMRKYKDENHTLQSSIPCKVLDIIKQSKKIKILKYIWYIDKEQYNKMFIYTK